MKKIILFSLLLSNFCCAQGDTTNANKWKYGINVSLLVPRYIDAALFPSFVMSKGKHTFSIGPKVFLDYYYNTPYGADVNYKLAPGKVNKIINFYFTGHCSYEYSKNSRDYETYDYASGKYYTVNQTSKYNYLAFYIGYGFDVKFLKRLHLNQFFALGPMFNSYLYKYKYDNDPSKNYERSGKLFSNINLDYIFNLGLGVDLGKIR